MQERRNRLFTSLFADNEGYRRIVEVLSGNRYGLTRDVLAEKVGMKTGGTLSDMLIDRADRVMNLCEMKFSQDDFAISKDYDERLRRKIVRLQEETGGKRNVQVTLVTTFGLKKNMYSSRVQRVVTLEDLFG